MRMAATATSKISGGSAAIRVMTSESEPVTAFPTSPNPPPPALEP